MKKILSALNLLLLSALILSSCNFPGSQSGPTPSDPMNAVNTAAAQTVIAMSTQMAATSFPTSIIETTQAPTQELPTQAPPATNTPVFSSGATSVPPTAIVCDRVEFVSDVTIPDGANFGPNAAFTKTWRIKNAGSCSWDSNYKLIFDSGDAMSGPASVNLPGVVAPGQVVDVSVNLQSPGTAGTYQGYWKLQNSSGARFGLGAGDKAFWVKITVGVTSVPFAVTSVSPNVDTANFTGACPHTFKFTYNITASNAGTVTYFFRRSDGATSSTQSIVFTGPGTQSVNYDWAFGAAPNVYDAWVELYVDNPNHQTFSRLAIKLTCNP